MRKTIKLLLLLAMTIVVQGAWADDDTFTGHGYEPYKVGSVEDLIELGERMKRHEDTFAAICYVVLTNDIDMSAYPDWTPIGDDKDETNTMAFAGTFNGMGHSIYNLKSQSGHVGLFWKLWGADIRNVNFRNVDLKGAKGSVVCTETVDATIENVNVMSGSISINESASGICVFANMIKRCENHANVTSPNTAAGISVNATNVVECINYGDVSAYAAAGISTSPNTTSEVQDCANYGTIDGTIAVGITLFSATGKLVNCLNSGRIKHTENPETPGSGVDKCSLLAYSDLAMELLGNNMYVAPQDNGSDSFNPVNSRTSIAGEALEIGNKEISNGFAAYYLQKYHQDNDEVPVWVWGQNLAKEGSHPILVKGNPNLDNPRVFGHVTMICDKTVSGEFSNEVSFGDSFEQMVNHSPEHVAIDHDCAIGGTQEHWVCQVCHKIFKDEECTEETSLDELTIPAGHDFAGGVCIYCGYDISITEGDYTISVAATGKDFDEEKLECFDYIRCFVPSRDGSKLKGSLSGGGSVQKAIEVFKKTEDGYKLIAGRIYLANPSFESEELEKGVDYYIGIRAIDKNVAINNVSLSIKLSCIQHEIKYVAEKEPTCTEHGYGEHWYCSVCGTWFATPTGGETDAIYYDHGLAEHKLVDGVCQECDYHVPTLKLAKDDDGNFTYSADNVEFDRKGVYWGESHSIFRVFIPEHGKLDVKAYVDPTSDVMVKSAHEFEYHESYPSGGGVQSAPQRRKAPEVYIPEQNTQVPGGGYVYILVNNEEKVTSKLEVTLYSHKDNVHEIEAKPATCTADGVKSHFYCDHEDCTFKILVGREWETTYYYFTEDGIGNPGDEELIIPATGHQFDEDGQCSVCGMKEAILADGENNVIFPRGIDQTTVFKYTATQTKRLNVTVETDAYILDQVIIPWSTWEKMQGGGDNDDRPASVRRRVGARNIEPLMAQNVVEGNVYAIAFLTDAESDTKATITLSYTELEYPELTEGENIINIAENYYELNEKNYQNPEVYEIYKYVPIATGTVSVSSNTGYNIMSVVFDADFNAIWGGDPREGYTVDVEKGNTYYIGIRCIEVGSGFWGYDLTLEMEGLLKYEGTLALDDTKSLEENLGEWKDIKMFTATRGVTYNRNATTSKWGTVILPYELKSNDDVTYYRLSQVGEAAEGETAVMTFSPVETVAPNTPTVYRFNKEASSYQYDASTTSQTLVTLPEYTTWIETQVDGLPEWTMCGFYEQHIINSNDNIQNYRYISKDKFMTASNTLTINPYRAVFRVGIAASAKTFVIAIADGGTTSIQAVATANGVEEVIGIYDINGRQLNTMQRGVNIIRTADGKTHKIINK